MIFDYIVMGQGDSKGCGCKNIFSMLISAFKRSKKTHKETSATQTRVLKISKPKTLKDVSKPDDTIKSILKDDYSPSPKFEEFLDDQMLVSRDAMGKKEMKIKVLEVTDEHPPSKWKLGDRVKAKKILVTVKHLESMNVEESEFDIEAIEAELQEKRNYSSSNRWIPTVDIKNGYVLKTRHMALISDAVALDYIIF